MKYFLLFLIILSFIGPAVDNTKSTSNVLKDSIYNYKHGGLLMNVKKILCSSEKRKKKKISISSREAHAVLTLKFPDSS